jgi:glycerol-3-phosphate acyltransferase PlsY
MKKLLIVAAAGYLLGSFPTSDLVAGTVAWRNGGTPVDLRKAGTQNPGALNAAKVLGARWGMAVLAGDVLKGVIAAVIGRSLAGANGSYAAGATAVVGHCAPPWNGFRGGKGIATSAGTSLVCFPVYAPVDVGLAAGVLALSRGRAEWSTFIASGCFLTAATYWWARRKSNAWGPEATIGLPLYAAATSAVILYRFLSAPDASGIANQPHDDTRPSGSPIPAIESA